MPHAPLRRLVARAAVALALATAAAACKDIASPDQDPTTTAFAPSLNVNLTRDFTRTASGLYVQDLQVGAGAVADTGKTVRTYYTGWLSSGRQFDSNRTGTTPLEFKLGGGSVIPGWEEGIKGMRVGGRRRLVIPPSLGYGSRTSGLIPAGSVLVFDIDLVGVT